MYDTFTMDKENDRFTTLDDIGIITNEEVYDDNDDYDL